MELRDGMFAVKLCELEHQYGLLRSRLELCQGADHEKIRHLLADVLDDYRENALLLEQSAEGCRSPAVAELAGVQRDYSKRMEELLRDIAHHALQDRTVALIQNGSWAPASGKLMAQILGEMKNMELLEQTVTLKSALAPGQDQELEALADALAASVRGEQEAPEQAVADAPKAKGFICKICGFIYESDTLPEDFRCPICGRPASDFEPVT